MPTKKLYRRLRIELSLRDITHADLAKTINRSPYYVFLRINGKDAWTLYEALKIMEIIGDSTLTLGELFPTEDVMGGVRRGA
ncbi:MAG TPA: hypothetical protein VN626_05735 [Clostridia bacterium]|nr:hypothetical protein [Clostridia bacterium]